MASFDSELLRVAEILIQREKGQRGKLTQARIRRSLSTTYYALFQFLADEVGRLLVGTTASLIKRRRLLARSISHVGAKTALNRVRGRIYDANFETFFAPTSAPPRFAQVMARTLVDAQRKRHDADYDLNARLSEENAKLLIADVRDAIAGWRAARMDADRDFKAALCTLILLDGKLRIE